MLSGEKKFSRLVCPVEEIETLHVQTVSIKCTACLVI